MYYTSGNGNFTEIRGMCRDIRMHAVRGMGVHNVVLRGWGLYGCHVSFLHIACVRDWTFSW